MSKEEFGAEQISEEKKSTEDIALTEKQKEALEKIEKLLSINSNYVDDILLIKDQSNLPNSIFFSAKIYPLVDKMIFHDLEREHMVEKIIKFRNAIDMPKEMFNQILKKSIIRDVERGAFERVIDYRKWYGIDVVNKIVSNPIVQNRAKEKLNFNNWDYFEKYYPIDQLKIIFSEDTLQDIAKGAMIHLIDMNNEYMAFKIKKHFEFSNKSLFSERDLKIIEGKYIQKIKNGYFSSANEFIENLSLTPDDLVYISDENVIMSEYREDIRNIENFATEGFEIIISNIPLYGITDVKILRELSEFTKLSVSEKIIKNIENINKIAKNLYIVLYDLIRNPKIEKIDWCLKILETIHIPINNELIKQYVEKAMIEILSTKDWITFLIVKDKFQISNDILFNPEVQNNAIKTMVYCLSNNSSINNAEEIKKRFNLPMSIIENPDDSSVKKELYSALTKYTYTTELDNVSIILSCCQFSQDELNSTKNYLIEQISNNSNLIKYIKFLGDEKIEKALPDVMQKAQEVIFSKLVEDQDLADYFVENLDKYYQQSWVAKNVVKAIQHYSVAQKFVHAVENLQKVWKDEPWVADTLTKSNKIVVKHKTQFPDEDWQDQDQDSYGYSHGNEGFSEIDPYENHWWRFGKNQVLLTEGIKKILAGENIHEIVVGKELESIKKKKPDIRIQIPKLSNRENAEWQQEVDENDIDVQTIEKDLKIPISNELRELLGGVDKKISSAYQTFLEQIRSNPNIKDEDKQILLNPESSPVKMTALLGNIRSFIARYFVQSVEGDVTRLSEIGNLSNDLDRILAEGFRRYIKIHEVDVPLYDKLYEEFDNLRETGRSPLEVYLGRDGIYAYIGRHSQDVARRRKLGLEGRKKFKEMGEVIEIHPQYTVYPRYFRDNINYETKRQFLEQEGISPDADPLFYDTGYTGTIPEQIMKVMDFSQEDIEKRIRLLSAPSIHRRVKGIPENARAEIIEYIEHNAKMEEAAEGLIIDEKTEKIRHIARPTNPEEQFYFMMVKQAIARHYWLQEQLHHEPSGNVNLDSEHFTIRIRHEYAKLFPIEFIQNPKEFLTQHGEMLKGSKGEGEYPDEEIVLFKMTDGTEIVAKKIELRKAKEARKEFSILISAKKAGLPTAEPVGFLSGKEESDGSYLLMKKIEGISGRNFDKYLRDTGKFTEEKIKSILQQVVQKNKEMAELFRTTLKIDKRWRIKDTIIELNEETGEVESVIPIDWERTIDYDENNPKTIDEIA